ncbi:MAG TPA: SAM-dependent methyltransferase [Trebonia sp.]|nr:SAM-dependent methyltransferase [Trebonia sp.]
MQIDATRAHPARMYDYLLGGTTNFAADRQAIEALLQAVPNARTGARENRAFLGRAVRYLVQEAGIRQFLDIGAGLPTAGNVHEVAQSIAPECRVAYVDNDPIVLAHAHALLASHPSGRTTYVQADLHDPGAILRHPAVRATLDFTQPIAIMLLAVLHFFPDTDDPAAIVAALLDAVPNGSYLVVSHVTSDFHDPAAAARGTQSVQQAGVPFRARSAGELAGAILAGLRLAEPGLVPVSEWRPPAGITLPDPSEVGYYGVVANKAIPVEAPSCALTT